MPKTYNELLPITKQLKARGTEQTSQTRWHQTIQQQWHPRTNQLWRSRKKGSTSAEIPQLNRGFTVNLPLDVIRYGTRADNRHLEWWLTQTSRVTLRGSAGFCFGHNQSNTWNPVTSSSWCFRLFVLRPNRRHRHISAGFYCILAVCVNIQHKHGTLCIGIALSKQSDQPFPYQTFPSARAGETPRDETCSKQKFSQCFAYNCNHPYCGPSGLSCSCKFSIDSSY